MGEVKIGADDDPIKMVNLHATSGTCCRLARGQPSVLIHNMEMRISQEWADFFRKVPYSLAETVWVQALRPACFVPFCCGCEYGVLYYPREPKVRTVSKLAPFHTDPVVLAVTLSPSIP